MIAQTKPSEVDPLLHPAQVAKLLGVSPGTLYNHIPDIKELRGVPRGFRTGSLEGLLTGPEETGATIEEELLA